MDANELLDKLGAWYPDFQFYRTNDRLYVNGEKICVLNNNRETNIDNSVIQFIKTQIDVLYDGEKPKENIYTMTHISTIGSLKKEIENYENDHLVMGNCVDMYGRWYNYPCYMAKIPGNNDMVVMQLKPINENHVKNFREDFEKKAKEIAYKVYKKTGQDTQEFIINEIMALIKLEN